MNTVLLWLPIMTDKYMSLHVVAELSLETVRRLFKKFGLLAMDILIKKCCHWSVIVMSCFQLTYINLILPSHFNCHIFIFWSLI